MDAYSAVVLLLAVLVKWFVDVQGHEGRIFVSQPKASYDYIVVGAGSAGSVVASRLSEDLNVTVLLVEAGRSDFGDSYISTPGFYTIISTLDPEVVANFFTAYVGMKNGQTLWPRGRVLGGTSSINAMRHVRGSRHDFDRWAAYTGDPTWSYGHVLSYFKKSENTASPELTQSVYHSTEGLLGVTLMQVDSLVGHKIIEGFQELGYPFNEDYNGREMEGISVVQAATENGERSSTSRAFLLPFVDRANLNIALNSHVQKMTINNQRAEGVELIKNGRKFLVKATREVILSAGTVETPQILMLSGIGPRKHLEELRIPVIADLPVGENLQDHQYLEIPIEINNTCTLRSPSYTDTLLQYNLHRGGLLSTPGVEVGLFTSVTKEAMEKDWPNLQVLVPPESFNIDSQSPASSWLDEELVHDYSYRNNVTNFFSFWAVLLDPTSRGVIKLRSTDPFDPPKIFPNYFDKQEDVEIIINSSSQKCSSQVCGHSSVEDLQRV